MRPPVAAAVAPPGDDVVPLVWRLKRASRAWGSSKVRMRSRLAGATSRPRCSTDWVTAFRYPKGRATHCSQSLLSLGAAGVLPATPFTRMKGAPEGQRAEGDVCVEPPHGAGQGGGGRDRRPPGPGRSSGSCGGSWRYQVRGSWPRRAPRGRPGGSGRCGEGRCTVLDRAAGPRGLLVEAWASTGPGATGWRGSG